MRSKRWVLSAGSGLGSAQCVSPPSMFSSLDFDLNQPWKRRQVTTPRTSVSTRMNYAVSGEAFTEGLVEAWAPVTLSKENEDFLQSSAQGEGIRIGSNSWASAWVLLLKSTEARRPAGRALGSQHGCCVLAVPAANLASPPRPALGIRELSVTAQLYLTSHTAGWRGLNLICCRSKGFPASLVLFPLIISL